VTKKLELVNAEEATTDRPRADRRSRRPLGARLRAALHPKALWRGFGRFRRTRPFWGAVVLAWGAYLIANPLLGGDFAFYAAVGVRGIAPLMIGLGMAAAAVIAVVLPAQRHFPAIMATALAVVALPVANLGGWIIGTVAGVVGAGMIFAWTPYSDKQLARFAAKAERKAERKATRKAARKAARNDERTAARGGLGAGGDQPAVG
jgi:hypothetical protein